MISAIQNKLQKHNKVVFFVLLAVIIVAFVFTIGAAPGLGGDERRAEQNYFGYNLASERDMRQMARIGQISYRVEHGDSEQPDQNRFQNYVFERVAYLGLADKLRIPGPTDGELQRFVVGRPSFQGDDGRFDQLKYDTFIDDIEADPQTSLGDVALVMEQDFRIEKAREIVGGPGYVLPTETRLQLERNQTLWSMDLATLNLTDFEPEIEVSDEKLAEFFEQNSFRYEREPRTSFSYALFRQDAFLDRVKDLSNDEVRAHFEKHRDRFTAEPPAGEADEEEPAEPKEEKETTLADVREEVEESLRREKATRLAGMAASDFAVALSREREARPGTPKFDELLERHRAELRDAPPASQSEFPPELRFPRAAQQEVFRLSEGRYFSNVVALRDDYIILLYRETLPSYVPPLEEVRASVERDYRDQERRRLLAEKGQELRESIRNRMDEGASFVDAAEAEDLTVQSVDRFSRIAPPPQVNRQLVTRLDEFEEGEVSAMIPLQSFGYFVYVRDREAPEIDRTGDEFVRTEENLRMWSSMANRHYVLQEFVERETGSGSN